MKNEIINKKHYSLRVKFALFIVIMASLLMFALIRRNTYDNNSEDKIKEVGYGQIEAINPLVLERAEKSIDKTSANLELIDEIKRVYNLNVIYGTGTEKLSESVEGKAIYDERAVNNVLVGLVECLEKYPNNIFKEIQLKDYDIEICLVDHFNNNNIALATRDSNNNFKIFLSNVSGEKKVKHSIHHETYHILEYYMKLEFDINKLYSNWNALNPPGFTYQENLALLDGKYVYGIDNNDDAYFVTVYSKTSDKEDRAEVFADTMNADKKPEYYTNNLGTIKSKIELISSVLNSCFYCVEYGTSIYWTRYL